MIWLAAFFCFVLGLSLREVVRFWCAAWSRVIAPAAAPDRWGQVHVDADQRRPFQRIGA